MSRRVLIVEDEFLISAMIQSALTRADYDVVEVARDCGSALDALNIGDIGAVTLDLSLAGGESSLPVAEKLQAQGIPYVIVSGYDASALIEKECLSPAAVIGKPFVIRELIDAVAQCLESRPPE
ncbi:response regulator [Thalassobacter stenotrophicus]|uniref:response regulator n=1 Tax=Thalassobacter stenotrophicus TaxID=266809 RepID=UPI0022A930AB|nr:response regulator [Thalassobacter stenotrophicus]UYP67327.1 response regulator [Thalassobacter stenotrophicus]